MMTRQRRGFLGLDIFGSEDDSDSGADNSNEGQQDRQDKQDGSRGSDAGNQDDDSDDGSPETNDDPAESELDKLKAKLKAADKHTATMQQRLKAFEDKDKSESERAASKAKEAEESASKLRTENQNLMIEIEVNRAATSDDKKTRIRWHNPEVITKFLDPEDFVEDGEIDRSALKKAIAKVAKENPYLVDSGNDKEESPGGPSGSRVGSKRSNNNDGNLSRENLRNKYPALG